MELTYSLDESDVIALAEYRLHYMPVARQRIQMHRYGYLAGFCLLAAGAWILHYPLVLVVLSLFVASALFLLYPTYYAWNLRRRVRAAYQDEKMRATLASRTLRATNDGLEEISEMGEVKVKWEAIETVTATPARTFITIVGGPPAMVISRERVTEGTYDGFIAACRAHIHAKSS